MSVLEKLQNIVTKSTNKYSLVTIVNWESYQQDIQKITNKRKTNGKQMNTKEEGKNEKKKTFVAPTQEDVLKYFLENGYDPKQGKKAWEYYEAGKWRDSTGKKVKSWKQKMRAVWFKDEFLLKKPSASPAETRKKYGLKS